MSIDAYSTTPALNLSISGINIAEGCPPSTLNNAIRQLMADIKVFWNAAPQVGSTLYIQDEADPLPGSPAENDILIQYTP